MKFARVSLAAVAAALAVSAPVAAETLQEALSATYAANPDLLSARAQQRSIDERVPRAISNWRPTVTGSGSVQWFEQDRSIPQADAGEPDLVIVTEGRQEQYRAELNQPIFRGFRNFNEYRQAHAQVYAGRADLLGVEQQVLLDAVTVYMNVLRDEAVLRLNENNVQVLTRQLQAAQDRFRVGEITRTDVAQSEARLARAISQRIVAEADLEASRATYRRVVGDYPGTLEQAPPLPALPATEEEAIAIALEENPAVVAARYNEQVAQYAVKTAKGVLLPTVSAQASFTHSEGPQNFGDFTADFVTNNRAVGVQINVPLYQSGAEYADIRAAKQVKSQRMLEIVSAERVVGQNVRIAWERHRAALSSIESTAAQVRANEIALEGVRQEAAVGSRTTLDVLDAEQELLDSRVNLVRAGRDEYVAGFSLLQSVGRLNAKTLDLPVELYDPADYYRDVKWKFFGWGTGYDD